MHKGTLQQPAAIVMLIEEYRGKSEKVPIRKYYSAYVMRERITDQGARWIGITPFGPCFIYNKMSGTDSFGSQISPPPLSAEESAKATIWYVVRSQSITFKKMLLPNPDDEHPSDITIENGDKISQWKSLVAQGDQVLVRQRLLPKVKVSVAGRSVECLPVEKEVVIEDAREKVRRRSIYKVWYNAEIGMVKSEASDFDEKDNLTSRVESSIVDYTLMCKVTTQSSSAN